MIRLIGRVTSDTGPLDVAGAGALCCQCGALFVCDTREEQQELHDGTRACPGCGDLFNVCAGPCCIRPVSELDAANARALASLAVFRAALTRAFP